MICALPSHESARLLRASLPALGAMLGRIEHQGTAIASFAFDAGQMKQEVNGMGFVVPKIAGNSILAGSFSSLKYAHRAPEGKLLLRIFAGGAGSPHMVEMPEAELLPLLQAEMSNILHIEGAPLFSVVAYWPRTMPQYHVGHRDLVGAIEEAVATEPTLGLAGNAFHGVGIPNCAQSGRLAAENLLVDTVAPAGTSR
ncbi:MAG TPA: protoporphyrinogen oxidase [Planctomycetaceae bacterium]|nr:protoporphyrinogen oxidase [Planctomycetaceae bacterium]